MSFFNDVGNWIDEKIIQPIGNWWNNGIENIKTNNSIDKRISEKIGEPIAKKGNEIINSQGFKDYSETVKDSLIENLPLATKEQKEEIKSTQMPYEPTNENTQETEEKGNLQEVETPSIKELWEREDAIRKETQEREDTAYQRAVEDMRKAGINPNLVGVNPASSGGGIISATGQNLISTEMSGMINTAIAEINNTVKADESQKDRISDIIRTLAQMIVMVKMVKK